MGVVQRAKQWSKTQWCNHPECIFSAEVFSTSARLKEHTNKLHSGSIAAATATVVTADDLFPLHIAADSGDLHTAQLLVQAKTNLSVSDARCFTAAGLACKNGHYEIVQLLLDAKTNVNAANGQAWTNLHIAACSGNSQCVVSLIDGKASVGSYNKDGMTPLQLAQEHGHHQVCDLLTKAESKWQARMLTSEVLMSGLISSPNKAFMAHATLIKTMNEQIDQIYSGTSLQVFGSCASGFALEDSDVDVCLVSSHKEGTGSGCLRALAHSFETIGLDCKDLITKARVPVLKLVGRYLGMPIAIDLCVNNQLAVFNSKLLRSGSGKSMQKVIVGAYAQAVFLV